MNLNCQVAVIGGGPGGLAAAVAAYDAGAEDVVIIERDRYLGGILQQCIHNGFGLSVFEEDLTGPQYAGRYIDQVHQRGIHCMCSAMVTGFSNRRRLELTVASEEDGIIIVRPEAVVLAMGCRERTRGAIGLAGSRPAGIMTAGTAQRLINVFGLLPGSRIMILGSGDIGMIMARRLHLEGCDVEAVVELQECVGGLSRNLVQCLYDFHIPLYLRHTVTAINGGRRLTSVDISPVDNTGKPGGSTTRTFECDTLLTSVGLVPENELSKSIGIELDAHTGGPRVDENFASSVPGVFAAGNVLQVYDLVDDVTRCGMTTGTSAANYVLGCIKRTDRYVSISSGHGVRSVVPQRIGIGPDFESAEAGKPVASGTPGSYGHIRSPGTNDRGIEFHLRSNRPMRKCTLALVDATDSKVITEKKYSVLRPSEMFKVTIPYELLKQAGEPEFRLSGGK